MTEETPRRPSSVIEAEYRCVRDVIVERQTYSHKLRRELREAQTAEALAAGHPWLGKKVRTKPDRWNGRVTHGIVVIATGGALHCVGHCPEPGEVYVRSPSSRTAYRFSGSWELDE